MRSFFFFSCQLVLFLKKLKTCLPQIQHTMYFLIRTMCVLSVTFQTSAVFSVALFKTSMVRISLQWEKSMCIFVSHCSIAQKLLGICSHFSKMYWCFVFFLMHKKVQLQKRRNMWNQKAKMNYFPTSTDAITVAVGWNLQLSFWKYIKLKI